MLFVEVGCRVAEDTTIRPIATHDLTAVEDPASPVWTSCRLSGVAIGQDQQVEIVGETRIVLDQTL